MRLLNRNSRRAYGLLAVCLVMTFSCGCGRVFSADSDPSPKSQPVPTIGDAIEVRAGANSAKITVSNLRRVPAGPLDAALAGKRDHYAVTVSITTTAGTWSANPMYFEFVSDRGTKGDRFATSSGVHELLAGTVRKGQTVEGDVVTSIPTGESIQRISTGQVNSLTIATWLPR